MNPLLQDSIPGDFVAAPLDTRIAARYNDLSGRLKQAADYIVSNPFDVATRSLRSVAEESDLAPASFSRLARALGYDSFGALRGDIRIAMDQRVNKRRPDRLKQLTDMQEDSGQGFMRAHFAACADNIHRLADQIDEPALEQVVHRLHAARLVLVMGELASSGVAGQMTYQASLLFDNWRMAGRTGSLLGAELAALGPGDALIIVTKPPFAARAVHAAALARGKGAFVVVITDTHTCPALQHASAQFIIPSESPNFFSSYAASLCFAETLIGMLAGIGSDGSRARIDEVERNSRQLHEVQDG